MKTKKVKRIKRRPAKVRRRQGPDVSGAEGRKLKNNLNKQKYGNRA